MLRQFSCTVGTREGMGTRKEPRILGMLKRPYVITLIGIVLLSLLLGACSPSTTTTSTPTTSASPSGGQQGFPAGPAPTRVPTFGQSGKVAPTVKVLPSVDPTLIIQFPLQPSSIKTLFPNATGLVTVMQGNPAISVFDTVIVDVQNMPPNVKFTVFLTELAGKPFGHAEYVGDVITRGDGSGEGIFHLIAFVAFAADNRTPTTSADQSGDASGIQLEHLGMWFDGNDVARQVLKDPTLGGTPFDGGFTAMHAGPQAMTDGQDLPVL